jgi:Ca2+-binding RTX toxin-like protein
LGEAGQDTVKNSPGAEDMGGGADFDVVTYSASTQRITADIGGAAGGDGAAGEGDTVRGDFEQLMGGAASDTLSGDDDGNLILGLDGNDVIDGRGGADSLLGGNDSDTLRSNDGVKDSVNCGADADQVDADALDAPVQCEGVAAPAEETVKVRLRGDVRRKLKVKPVTWATDATSFRWKSERTLTIRRGR